MVNFSECVLFWGCPPVAVSHLNQTVTNSNNWPQSTKIGHLTTQVAWAPTDVEQAMLMCMLPTTTGGNKLAVPPACWVNVQHDHGWCCLSSIGSVANSYKTGSTFDKLQQATPPLRPPSVSVEFLTLHVTGTKKNNSSNKYINSLGWDVIVSTLLHTCSLPMPVKISGTVKFVQIRPV